MRSSDQQCHAAAGVMDALQSELDEGEGADDDEDVEDEYGLLRKLQEVGPSMHSGGGAAACCLLPAACCLLPAACCLLPTANCQLPRISDLTRHVP